MPKVTFVLLLCLLFSVAGFGIANVAEDGLVGFWAFDEGSGKTAADVTGNGHDGKFEHPNGLKESSAQHLNLTV